MHAGHRLTFGALSNETEEQSSENIKKIKMVEVLDIKWWEKLGF